MNLAKSSTVQEISLRNPESLHVVKRRDELSQMTMPAGVQELLNEAARCSHFVQFYENDDYLLDSVTHFIATGLQQGEPALLVATPVHGDGILRRLRTRDLEVDTAMTNGRLVLQDAATTLAQFMVDDMPDWTLFREAIGGITQKCLESSEQPRMRAFGEMVDLLWQRGNRLAAIALEGMWNKLASERAFSLHCAYLMGGFCHANDGEAFRELCAAHKHVIPAEQPSLESESKWATLSETAYLQQRARSLENELSHRKEVEGALRESLERERQLRTNAQEAVHYNEMFAGMLGHDLRNPLGAIMFGSQYITRSDSSPEVARAAARISRSAERMSRMIDQLLDLTRIRVGGGLSLERTHFDLRELFHQIKEELETRYPTYTIVLEILGGTDGDWDHDRLLQVFSNLLDNAVNHGTTTRVSARVDGRDQQMTVEIHNDGAIPLELVPVIFEPFRGQHKLPKTSGLGLGLHISRQIVLTHGGKIEAISNEEIGTTLRVILPR